MSDWNPTEREWLEGLRYEDKFPEPREIPPGAEFPYFWFWHRMGRKGQRLRVVCRGAMNSALVEFEDGFHAVVSRNGIRRAALERGGNDA